MNNLQQFTLNDTLKLLAKRPVQCVLQANFFIFAMHETYQLHVCLVESEIRELLPNSVVTPLFFGRTIT